jgi:hypothetical protein
MVFKQVPGVGKLPRIDEVGIVQDTDMRTYSMMMSMKVETLLRTSFLSVVLPRKREIG